MLLYDSKSGDQKKKGSAVSPGPTQTNEHVETLRRNFTSSGLNVFLVHLQTLAQPEQEHTLKNLQGIELAKILKALEQPAFMGKRKEKQINTLLEAAGLVCARFPDEVMHLKQHHNTFLSKKIY